MECCTSTNLRSSSHWPPLVESHLVFLIRKFNLSSVSCDKITHGSISIIVQATQIYVDQAEWTSIHHSRFWEKTNMKIGYIHAQLTKMRNQLFVEQCSLERLCSYLQQPANLQSLSMNQNYIPQSPMNSRASVAALSTSAFPTLPGSSSVASQESCEGKEAFDLWKSMSSEDQAKLIQYQLQTSKGFNTLVRIMDQYYKAVRSRAIALQEAAKAIPAEDPIPAPTKQTKNDLRLQTNSPSSTISHPQTSRPAGSEKHSGTVEGSLDSLPSPTKSPGEKWITASFSPEPSDISQNTNPVPVTHKHKDKLADNSAHKHIQDLKVPEKLDVKAIMQNRLRELELKREREEEAAEEEREIKLQRRNIEGRSVEYQ
ncbi:hypothetical protein VTL71DRAFT_16407 [Oculimacula yallundae]|uniref:Uncharacterized protein n=1 Tax=Oculimacula yallundae TaxID=86028 RepID=A0ABR4CEB6_9HELO